MKINDFLVAQQITDPGLGSKYKEGSKRLMNQDGSFNVIKDGAPGNIRDFYQDLIKMTWARFLTLSFLFIFTLNLLFALVYVGLGMENLVGDKEGDFWQNLTESFYFSFQTFTTVGYGHISPVGKFVNLVAVIEAATGLMVFAVITGLLYGRFSKPSIRLLYSKNAIIAPYQDGWALMFRVVNLRKSLLLESSANVALTIHVNENGEQKRKYYRMNLEIPRIEFFASSWTLVHKIDEESPFQALDLANIHQEDLEIIIQIKAYDDTFAQNVHSRFSYQNNEIIVGAKFKPATKTDEEGNVVIPLDEFHDFEKVPFVSA